MTIISIAFSISVLLCLTYHTFILLFFVVISMKLRYQLPSVPLVRLLLSIRRRIAKRCGRFTNTPSSNETDLSSIESCASHIRKWTEQCDEHHDDTCRIISIAERPSWQIPDWVIDAEEGCIVPGDSVQRYAALSYVWDLPEQQSSQRTLDRLMLRSDNVEAFQTPGFLSRGGMTGLPVVVKDSLELVLQTGIRYLWVDCLCIVQHAETTRSRVEAMKEIYSGAYVTIIAATTSGRLFVPRTSDSAIEEAGGGTPQQPPSASRYEDLHKRRDLHASLLASHWASRGWTFQEHLLSKRSINFLDDITFWDCESSVWWPGLERFTRHGKDKCSFDSISTTHNNYAPAFMVGDDTLGIADTYEEVQKHENLSQALKRPSILNFRLYMELICRYNHRSLTYPQDALPAFSGVLKSVTQDASNSFICGLPVLFLDAALLWQPLWKAKRRVATDTGRNVAPPTPLPSWSWVGWQCLIDAESMVSGLDYEVKEVIDGKSVPPQSFWRTTKLVDWYSLTDKNQSPGTALKEHQLMDSCKNFQSFSYAGDLPEGWSRKSTSEFVSTEEVEAWQRQRVFRNWGIVREEEDIPEPKSYPIQLFFHGTQDDTLYYYPFPSINTSSVAASSLNDAAFLSCTTMVAHFNVRRMLVCKPVYIPIWHSVKSLCCLGYSVRRTTIYKTAPGVKDCNSIITLEDGQGRWAGLLKVMDDETESVYSGQMLQLIAISKGSASRGEVANTYEAHVDNYSQYQVDDCLPKFFFPSDDSQQPSVKTTASDSSMDLGPLNSKNVDLDKHSEWKNETYSFYNVLWVETKDGVMYRKAAGRISEDIWEQTCGAPQRIVLG